MYKQVETDKNAVLDNGVEFTPVATLADEYGGRCQISIDDHCYILRLKQSDGKYKTSAWIFPEAFEVLKKLPSLCVRAGFGVQNCQPELIPNRSTKLELTTSARMTQNECYAVGLCQTNKN